MPSLDKKKLLMRGGMECKDDKLYPCCSDYKIDSFSSHLRIVANANYMQLIGFVI
jgi:hypothetical protein